MKSLPGSRLVRNVLSFIVLFCVARLLAGVLAIAFLDRDSVAWGLEMTIITAVAVAACLFAALAVRRYAPPRRS